MNEPITFPTDEECKQQVAEALAKMKRVAYMRHLEALLAGTALHRLVDVMRDKTGQGLKLRSFLYSLWNGKPAPLINVLNLDHELRSDLCAVIAGFGWEDAEVKFFYDAFKSAVQDAGLWEWFLEERSVVHED